MIDNIKASKSRPRGLAPTRETTRPSVFINMAMTADGKIATANRAVTTFGSARDLAHLYELRATADAILCGARTVEETGATLGNGGDQHRRARLRRGLTEFPLRIVASGSGSLSPTAAIWEKRFSPILVLTSERARKAKLARLRRLATHVWVSPGAEVDLAAALVRLKTEFGVRRLLCEGGGELNDALFRAGLVDEVRLTICPRIFGGRAAPTIAGGPGFARLADAAQFELVSTRRHGDELFLVYRKFRAQTP
jgi:riboflavin-specific deaminase-like protein